MSEIKFVTRKPRLDAWDYCFSYPHVDSAIKKAEYIQSHGFEVVIHSRRGFESGRGFWELYVVYTKKVRGN